MHRIDLSLPRSYTKDLSEAYQPPPRDFPSYLPATFIGEDLVIGQVQLVPLQQKLQLPIPVILVLLIGAKG